MSDRITRLCQTGLTQRQARLALVVILSITLAFRLSIWYILMTSDPARFLDNDSVGYFSPARALLHLGVFVESPDTPQKVETLRTPGYPVFLAGIYAVSGESDAAVILVQITISLATVALLFFLAESVWGSTAALFAALLLALDVATLSWAFRLTTETLYTFLLVLTLAAGIRLLESRGKVSWAVILGALLAVATLVRPISYYLVVPLALGMLVVGKVQAWHRRSLATSLVLFLLPFIVLVGGWQFRNYFLTGSAQLSSVEGLNMLYYKGASVVALRDRISVREARQQLGWSGSHWQEYERYFELHPETRGWSLARLSSRWKQEGLSLILAHPLLFIRSQLPGLVGFAASTGEGPLLRVFGVPIGSQDSIMDLGTRLKQPVALFAFFLALIYLLVVYTGVLYWWWDGLRRRKIGANDLFMWGVMLYFVIASAEQGYSRFRVPVMPILALYGGLGLLQLCRYICRRLAERNNGQLGSGSMA